MRIIVSADDFGASPAVTQTIAQAVMRGAVTSVSVLANGAGAVQAFHFLREHPEVRVAVHLNFVEGRPLTAAVPFVDGDGFFSMSFFRLWAQYFFSLPKQRRIIELAVRSEIEAQIHTVRVALGDARELHIDSHQHVHMIPFVFDIVCDVALQERCSMVRLAREPVMPLVLGSRSLIALLVGYVKHLLLNALSLRAWRVARRKGIAVTDFVIGTMYSCMMDYSVVARALDTCALDGSSTTVVEILFHPGQARADEEHLWSTNARLRNFYRSEWRTIEATTVTSQQFIDVLARFK